MNKVVSFLALPLLSGFISAQTLPTNVNAPVAMTREQAEVAALKNNPRISAARLLSLAQGELIKQERAAELPQIVGSLTAVKAEDGTRVSAGQLNSSRLYTHAGAGGTFSQLITDFGRTPSMVAAARLRTKAEQQNALATEQDVIFATDQAFYKLLNAKGTLDVARQAVAARRDARDLTKALAASKLKSELDLNTAAANLSQSELLQLDAENAVQSASAALSALLGLPSGTTFDPQDDSAVSPPIPPENIDSAETMASTQRPDLRAAQLDAEAQRKFAHAQALQNLPTISALATGGGTPVRPDGVFPRNWYAAAGINLSIPLFTGFRVSAEAKEARFRAQAQEKLAADLSNGISRDVRIASLAAQTAFRKIQVAEAFRAQSAQALSLAQTRYKLGLSSIVELSQAQFQSTDAAVSAVNARFDYLLALRSLDYAMGRISP